MKFYELKFTVTDDGMLQTCEASNQEFTAPELIGLLEVKKQDILRQMLGEVKPEIMFKRTRIVDDKEEPACTQD